AQPCLPGTPDDPEQSDTSMRPHAAPVTDRQRDRSTPVTLPTRLTALTFDFWNTLYSANDTSWTEVRQARLRALRDMLASAGLDPTEADLQRVYDAGFAVYVNAWIEGRHFGAQEEVSFFLQEFGIEEPSVDREVIERAISGVENAARFGALPLLPGVAETIPWLAASGYRLGVISDTSLTPGRVLSEFLEADGLLQHFSALTFSDQTGYTKPDPRMFEQTLARLEAAPADAAHIGDTPRTDIAGAKAMGMLAIRCAGATDTEEPPEADYVIRDHRELPAILERLG
ncbi:MAG: HAD family hydrolase, partial [Thermoleophilia bacterium]|nr:HAD family hydrolase [Thermoleophilia bacterium]